MLGAFLMLGATAGAPDGEVTQERHTTVSSLEDSPRSPFAARPLLLELQLGIAMPTGIAGLFVDYSLAPALSLAAGAGTNLTGFEAAAELRLRGELKSGHALTLAGGYSLGPHTQTRANQFGFFSLFLGPMTAMGEPQVPSAYNWDLAHWVNVSFGYERRRPSGSSLRVFGGPAFMMNPEDGQPSQTENPQELRPFERVGTMVFAGCAIGYAL
jgi:hypothetical protein